MQRGHPCRVCDPAGYAVSVERAGQARLFGVQPVRASPVGGCAECAALPGAVRGARCVHGMTNRGGAEPTPRGRPMQLGAPLFGDLFSPAQGRRVLG